MVNGQQLLLDDMKNIQALFPSLLQVCMCVNFIKPPFCKNKKYYNTVQYSGKPNNAYDIVFGQDISLCYSEYILQDFVATNNDT